MDKNQGEIHTHGYELLDDKVVDPIIEILAKQVDRIISEIMEDESTALDFPGRWKGTDGYNGKEVDDPLTVYLALNAGKHREVPVIYSTSLREVLLPRLDAHIRFPQGMGATGYPEIANALRELADEIDNRLSALS